MIGPWQIAIVALIVVLLFGRGKISGLMGELGSGITSFKKGLKAEPKEEEPKVIDKTDAINGEVVKSKDDEKTDA